MRENGFWRVFRETGDPLCYVIARRIEKGRPKSGSAAAAGEAYAALPLAKSACADTKD